MVLVHQGQGGVVVARCAVLGRFGSRRHCRLREAEVSVDPEDGGPRFLCPTRPTRLLLSCFQGLLVLPYPTAALLFFSNLSYFIYLTPDCVVMATADRRVRGEALYLEVAFVPAILGQGVPEILVAPHRLQHVGRRLGLSS